MYSPQGILRITADWTLHQRYELIDALLANEPFTPPTIIQPEKADSALSSDGAQGSISSEEREMEQAWCEEAAKRLDEIRTGQATTVDWLDVEAKSRELINHPKS